MNRLRNALKVRADEGRTAGLGVGLMLVTAGGAALGQSGVDALFFARSGPEKLPVLLLFSGGVMFGVSIAVTALLGRVERGRLFAAIPLVVAAALLAERALVAADPSWIYPVLWLSAGVAQMLQGLFTWGMAGIVVDTRQAKRLFPLFSAGGILGAVIGGALTRPLAAAIGAENLLLVWAAGLVAAFATGRALVAVARRTAAPRRRARRRSRLLDEMQQGFRFVRGSPVMRWLSLAAVLFSVLFYSLYLPFSRAATVRYPSADALAGFFGLFSAVTTGAALVSSLFLTNRLFARFGVATAIVLLPLIYLVGFGVLIVDDAFVVLVAIRVVQMIWISSIAGPAWEAVINVVPPARRDQTRAFVNGGPAQAGTIIAGLVLLIGDKALGASQLYAIGLGAAALTTFAMIRARRAYAGALVDALRAGRPEVFPTRADEEPFLGREVDGTAVEALTRGVRMPDVHVRRAAVEILGDLPRPEAVPALREALADTDAMVRATALRSLARTGDASARSAAEAALADPDPAVRLAAVRGIANLGDVASDVLRPALGDEDPAVRAAAAAGLLGGPAGAEALAALRAMLGLADPTARALALGSLATTSRAPSAVDLAAGGLADPEVSVRAAAAGALGAGEPERAIPVLVPALGDPSLAVREAAAEALGRHGAAAIEPVLGGLFDPLLAEGALLALERLPAGWDAGAVRGYAREETARAVADASLARAIGDVAGDRECQLRDSLLDRARRQGLRALRAAGLLGDRAAFGLALDNLASPDRAQVANAIEALESLGEPTIVRPLLPLWEPAPAPGAPRDTWLPALLRDPDPWVHDCAVLVGGPPTEGVPMTDALATLSDLERVLFLRKVALFAELAPRDLERIARIAEEETYVDGETIAAQGESGEELHIVVEGRVRVLREGTDPGTGSELAVRSEGDVVGEMALITGEPRMATLVASGDVRTLRVGRTEFEGVLRERPETAIAVIRVLSRRLVESAAAT